MSFQHFRLGEIPLHQHQPLPPHLVNIAAPSTFNNSHAENPTPTTTTKQKQPYGSGDSDDGYNLIFPNLVAFQAWRKGEEEHNSVEFVKGDTHGSKAVPPRFKDHTKLVCARHSRTGKKKYVKKHPERTRKVPSRKLEGAGCPASISYKTYYDTEEVRARYNSQHSHDIGHANLPFTRRGRRAAVQQVKDIRSSRVSDLPSAGAADSSPNVPTPTPTSESDVPTIPPPNNTPASVSMFSTSIPTAILRTESVSYQTPPQPQSSPASAVPAPPQPFTYTSAPQPYISSLIASHTQPSVSHDRWENMTTLFHSIRNNARAFEYSAVSVAALETILIRLYLETPMNMGQTAINMDGQGVAQSTSIHTDTQTTQNEAQAGDGRTPDDSVGVH